MGKRHRGRILAFQALFAWDAADNKKASLTELLDFSWTEKTGKKAGKEDSVFIFSRLLFAGTVENIKTVDSIIRKHLENWDFSRLTGVDRALLRLSVYELLFKTAPPQVVINEAIDIAREYGTDDSYRFINGVLDGVRKTLMGEDKE